MKVRSHCPINFTLEHFGDKWSLLILRDLIFKGKRHYNAFFESEEKVSTSVLGDRLKSLENFGIISKGKDETKKSRIKYSLTHKGLDMLPILVEMVIWGEKYDAETEAHREFMEDVARDKEGLLKRLRQQLEKEHF